MAGCKHTCKYHFGWVTCWSCSYFSVPNLLTYAWHPSQGTGFWQGTSSVLGHLLFFLCDAICIPASWSLLKDPFCQVFFGCPLFLFPGGFHVKACLVFAVYVRSILFNTTAKKNKKTNKKNPHCHPKACQQHHTFVCFCLSSPWWPHRPQVAVDQLQLLSGRLRWTWVSKRHLFVPFWCNFNLQINT